MLHKKAQAPFPLPSPILDDVTFRKWHLCLLCSISQPPHVPDIWSALWDVCPRCPVSSVGYHHLPRSTNSMTWWPADDSVGSAPRNPVTGLPFFNCTLQQPRIIVQYSVIVGENLVQFHQPRPHYDHFSSILSTKQQWRISMRTRPVRRRQNGAMSWTQITYHRVMMYDHMVEYLDCVSQEVQHQRAVTHLVVDRSVVLQSCHPTQLR